MVYSLPEWDFGDSETPKHELFHTVLFHTMSMYSHFDCNAISIVLFVLYLVFDPVNLTKNVFTQGIWYPYGIHLYLVEYQKIHQI